MHRFWIFGFWVFLPILDECRPFRKVDEVQWCQWADSQASPVWSVFQTHLQNPIDPSLKHTLPSVGRKYEISHLEWLWMGRRQIGLEQGCFVPADTCLGSLHVAHEDNRRPDWSERGTNKSGMVGVEMSSFLPLKPHGWSIVEAAPSTFPFHFHFHFQFRACLLTTRPKYELDTRRYIQPRADRRNEGKQSE